MVPAEIEKQMLTVGLLPQTPTEAHRTPTDFKQIINSQSKITNT